MTTPRRVSAVGFVALFVVIGSSCLFGDAESAQYLGKFLGKLTELNHGVSGEVYAVDARTLHIKDFTYDGQGPAAYFFAGTGRTPGTTGGFRLRDENGNPEVLRRYRKEGITITLPDGKTINSIKWFYVWCEEFEVNFGDVKIPRNFDYPKPQKVDGLRGVHGVSSDNIVIVDAQTLLVPNLSYDGEAPDAKFWVGRGPKPSPQGIRVPDENGKVVPLRRYDHKTVVLTLPGDLTVFDIGHFGIWCEAFTVDFGHVLLPQNSLNVPPSLKMLGVSPQKRARAFDFSSSNETPRAPLVGGAATTTRIEATTYRPPTHFTRFNNNAGATVQRRLDNSNALLSPQQQQQPQSTQQHHEVVNRDIYSHGYTQNLINPGFLNQQQQQQQQQQPTVVQQQYHQKQYEQYQKPQQSYQQQYEPIVYNQQQQQQLFTSPGSYQQQSHNNHYQAHATVQLQHPRPFQQQQVQQPAAISYNQLIQPGAYDQQKLVYQQPIQQRIDNNVYRQGIAYTPFVNYQQQQYNQQQQVDPRVYNQQFVAQQRSSHSDVERQKQQSNLQPHRYVL